MKKNIVKHTWVYLMAICCALFVACEPAKVTSPEETGNPIGFGETGRYNGSHKKQIDDAFVNGTLWGYYGTYMVYDAVDIELKKFNYKYEYKDENGNTIADFASADIDIEGPQRYWTDNTYHFFSIYPKVANATLNMSKVILSCSFDISADENNFQDTLRIAKSLNIDGGNYNENNTAVKLRYENMLSRIKFVAYSDLTNIPVTLNSIALTTPKTATYTASTGGYTQSNLSTTEKTTITESGQYTLYWNGYTGQTGYAGTLIRDEGFLVVHPGAVTNSTFVVKYQDAAGTEVTTEPIAFPTESGVTEWQRGQSYIYTLKIKTAGEIEIEGNVTIQPWTPWRRLNDDPDTEEVEYDYEYEIDLSK